MNKKFFRKNVFMILGFFVFIANFNQAHAQCEVGVTLFRDTLYGAAVGAGAGALILIANQSTKSIAPQLASATLVGAGVGVIVGVIELSFSDCFSKDRQNAKLLKPGFRAQPLIGFNSVENNLDMKLKKADIYEELNRIKINDMAFGVTLSYTFAN
ncbi:MAG: hypothetical protein DCC88_02635 [Spirobacillus cienkowskii]|uniref:Glycine zipper family protein n=1 Tax=Spirobacillus cienkowskii TaxID=495820 RepID=A0A369KVT8_9BACT|nr:MAG: hypothetical protein DCC88_02635 [Spirobacillus cienkowskii]